MNIFRIGLVVVLVFFFGFTYRHTIYTLDVLAPFISSSVASTRNSTSNSTTRTTTMMPSNKNNSSSTGTPPPRCEHNEFFNNNSTTTTISNLRIAFIGDSVSRYQYISLIHYLKFGYWEPPGTFPSIVEKAHYADWNEYNINTSRQLYPPELIDANRNASYENRYYLDRTNNNTILYFNKNADEPVLVHYSPQELLDRIAAIEYAQPVHRTWEYQWDDLIRKHIAPFRVDYAIVNQGLWYYYKITHLANVTVQDTIAKALKDTEIVGIYKTTSAGRKGKKYPDRPYERELCHKLPVCHNLSWTVFPPFSYRNKARYFTPDGVHFKEPIYRFINEQLFDLIKSYKYPYDTCRPGFRLGANYTFIPRPY